MEALAFSVMALSLPVMLTAAGATKWQRREIRARFYAESVVAPRTGDGALSRLLDALWP